MDGRLKGLIAVGAGVFLIFFGDPSQTAYLQIAGFILLIAGMVRMSGGKEG